MSIKYIKHFIPLFLTIILVLLSNSTAQAASPSSLEVGEVRSLGNEVQVPVTIFNTTYLTSGQVEIVYPSNDGKATLSKFETTGIFAEKTFNTSYNISGNRLLIDFHSIGNLSINLNNKPTVIGYITYTLSNKFIEGESIGLEISSLVAKGRNGADLLLNPLSGKIERKMPIGDVIGKNKPTAAGAMRILQHVNNGDLIIDREAQLSADVDKDGKITQSDAQQILDYITGKNKSFLAIAAQELDNAVLKSEYNAKIEAFHGRAPYTFTAKTVLPGGLKLNAGTGEITGIPTYAKNYTFTIAVTDTLGYTATRTFTLDVIDSNIISVEKLATINVKLNEVPNLPDQVTVTYKDKTTGKEKVQWETVDTSKLGETIARGVVGNTGFKVSVPIQVVNANYINNIKIGYFQILNFHTITISVIPEVYIVTVNGLNALYEGNNQFSLANPNLKSGTTVTIKAFDKYGNLLETKMQQLVVN